MSSVKNRTKSIFILLTILVMLTVISSFPTTMHAAFTYKKYIFESKSYSLQVLNVSTWVTPVRGDWVTLYRYSFNTSNSTQIWNPINNGNDFEYEIELTYASHLVLNYNQATGRASVYTLANNVASDYTVKIYGWGTAGYLLSLPKYTNPTRYLRPSGSSNGSYVMWTATSTPTTTCYWYWSLVG